MKQEVIMIRPGARAPRSLINTWISETKLLWMTEGSSDHFLPPANFQLSLKCSLPSPKTTRIIPNTKTGYVSKETVRESAPISQLVSNPVGSNCLQGSWAVNWAFTLTISERANTYEKEKCLHTSQEETQFPSCKSKSRAEGRALLSLSMLHRNPST